MDSKWDKRFIELAEFISQWSRDPRTKVGAVIVRPDKTIASVGFNGFPRGVDDNDERYNDRETKYKFICHAEANAILTATEKLAGYTLYVSPLLPCHECAKMIIQTGITRVVARATETVNWKDSNDFAQIMFKEAGVTVDLYSNRV